MPVIGTLPNNNIGDYGTVSGDFASVSGSHALLSGDYVTTSGTVSDYITVSGDYASLSGTNWDYPVHSGSVVNPHHVTLDEVEDPDVNVNFNFGNKTIEFRYTAPSPSADTGAFTIEAGGGFVGDLVHIHQMGGNPGDDTHLVHLGAEDADVHLLHITPPDNTASGICLESGIFTLFNEARIVNSPDPVNAQDVATKNWSDTTFATITNFNTVSGDYATTSGTVDGYAAHVASSISHHNPTGYETISGDYLTTSGTVEDYATLSGDYSTHQGSSSSHHDPTGYETVSGDYLTTSGTVEDYVTVSGDFSTLSGDWGDFDKTPGGGAGHITGLSGGAWSVFYSETDEVITGLALGLSGLVLSSMGTTSAPVWAAKSAGGGDDLGSHIATLILDMSSKRITGVLDPTDDQDAATKIFVDNHDWTEADITDFDSSGLFNVSGDYLTTSGTVDGYAAHVASSVSHHDTSGILTMSGEYVTHAASSTSHHDTSGILAMSGDYLITSGTIDDYIALSGDFSTLDTDYPITSGTVDGYAAHVADNDAHHEPTALNDTPTDGENTTGATSNWAYDHEQLSSVHHIVTAINDTPTDAETTTGSSSNWAYDHTQNPTDLNHITDAQLGALHTVYTLEEHDNTAHNPDYLANVSEDGSPQLGADLDLAGYNISLAPSFGSDHQHEGIVVSITTDAGAYGQGLYMKSNGAYALAQADAAGTMPCSAIYVASGKVLLIGTIRDDTYDFTVGGYVYISEASAGLFTTTVPSTSTNLVQKVGIALSADSMYFNPGGFRIVTVA